MGSPPKWRDDGTAETVHDLLRWQAREILKRHEDPTAVVLDSQTVRASVNAPKDTTGRDPGKKSPGRKRDIATDVLGLVIAVVVVAASVHDNTIGIALLDKVAATAPTVTKSWVDAGFKQAVVEHGARLCVDWRSPNATPGQEGSPRNRNGGWWSSRSARSCCTADSRGTTRRGQSARWR
ncbi:transposase [Streptomyces mirabilis]